MSPLLSRLLSRVLSDSRRPSRRPRRRPRVAPRRPYLEALEDRCLPSVTVSVGDSSANEGVSALKAIDQFVPNGSGGLSRARSSVFGPDGNLYVASADTNSVLRYNGATGAFIDAFVPSGSGGLNSPWDLAFSAPDASFPDGCL